VPLSPAVITRESAIYLKGFMINQKKRDRNS
jgi:hypothetical protein